MERKSTLFVVEEKKNREGKGGKQKENISFGEEKKNHFAIRIQLLGAV